MAKESDNTAFNWNTGTTEQQQVIKKENSSARYLLGLPIKHAVFFPDAISNKYLQYLLYHRLSTEQGDRGNTWIFPCIE